MSRAFALLTFAAATLVLAGCASDNTASSDRPRESSIPWNRPQTWEGPGVYGSAVNQR
jgi:hypothetical protein